MFQLSYTARANNTIELASWAVHVHGFMNTCLKESQNFSLLLKTPWRNNLLLHRSCFLIDLALSFLYVIGVWRYFHHTFSKLSLMPGTVSALSLTDKWFLFFIYLKRYLKSMFTIIKKKLIYIDNKKTSKMKKLSW